MHIDILWQNSVCFFSSGGYEHDISDKASAMYKHFKTLILISMRNLLNLPYNNNKIVIIIIIIIIIYIALIDSTLIPWILTSFRLIFLVTKFFSHK